MTARKRAAEGRWAEEAHSAGELLGACLVPMVQSGTLRPRQAAGACFVPIRCPLLTPGELRAGWDSHSKVLGKLEGRKQKGIVVTHTDVVSRAL